MNLSVDKPVFTDGFVGGYLFKNGLALNNYFMRRSPNSEVICYKNGSGQKVYLVISNDELFQAVFTRLVALGVTVETFWAEFFCMSWRSNYIGCGQW